MSKPDRAATARRTSATNESRTRDLSIQFRLDEAQYEAIAEAARREGDTMANWCRRNLLKLSGWVPA